MTPFCSYFSFLLCVKLEFIGSRAVPGAGAVVYPSALGNTLVCLQQLELQKRREKGKSAVLTCSCREYGGEGERQRDRERGSNVVKAWKMDPYVWRTM